MKVFSKQKMLERIKKEGMMKMVDDDVIAIMDSLDGQEVNSNCWNRVVLDQPVYYCIGKDGKGHYVNEEDCI